MISEQEFLFLLTQIESDILDFKSKNYHLSDDASKSQLIKDVLCMANTPREKSSFIIIGVNKRPDSSYELHGLDKHLDDANLQSQFSERVHPVPSFIYGELSYQGKVFGVIEIPPRRVGPCVPIADFRGILRQRQVYFRRGSKNDIASPEDLHHITNWINIGGTQPTDYPDTTPEWDKFLDAVRHFDTSQRYVLLAGTGNFGNSKVLNSIGRIPWTGVFDYDPNSESSGLLHAVKEEIEVHRSVHLVVAGERPTLNPERATYWFFARGLDGRAETIASGSWQEWKRQYGGELDSHFRRLAETISPAPVVCIALWYEAELIRHLQSSLESALSSFGDYISFVVVTKHPADLQPTAEYGATVISIPLHQLCSGLQNLLSSRPSAEEGLALLPSSSSAPIPLDLNVAPTEP